MQEEATEENILREAFKWLNGDEETKNAYPKKWSFKAHAWRDRSLRVVGVKDNG